MFGLMAFPEPTELELKPISRAGVPGAVDKAERYRLLNEPGAAESICRDVLRIEPGNQRALVTLLLALTDQFDRPGPSRINEARAARERLQGEYERAYYQGILCERAGKAELRRAGPAAEPAANNWLREAMTWYEQAEAVRPAGNDDAILRWNACARLLRDRRMAPRAEDLVEQPIE
jgi:hypothetical protein